jgi:glycosyltransferase involved in cell wall biosynthesis
MPFVVAIPAYNPDERMVELVRALREGGLDVLLVDDGSREESAPFFRACEEEYGCDLVRHPQNRGKGAALKSIASRVAENYAHSHGYVTADCDLQHSPEDILKVARALEEGSGALILGCRDFSQPGVPLRSRWGNRITSFIFFLKTGQKCSDTQTGLRGIPAQFASEAASLPGERFEYEMNVLMEAARRGVPFREVPIATVYIDHNKSSSFRAVNDSARIYWNILKFGCTSFLSAIADLGLFWALSLALAPASKSAVFAISLASRCLSGVANFLMNKVWVFSSNGQPAKKGMRYLALFLFLMLSSSLLTSALSFLSIPLVAIKICVDAALFSISYFIQRKYIF